MQDNRVNGIKEAATVNANMLTHIHTYTKKTGYTLKHIEMNVSRKRIEMGRGNERSSELTMNKNKNRKHTENEREKESK